ncbi:MAG: aldo/keto reductase [Kiritimatiellia bacterium]
METPVIFGTSCLGNLYKVVPFATKLEIVSEWFQAFPRPFVDSAGKYGAGLALECIGRALRALGKRPGDLTISVKLGWRRQPLTTPEPTFEPGAWAGLEWDARQDISAAGILRCYEEARELLGYPIDYVSVHDPDEYLQSAADGLRASRRADVLGAYAALFALKARGEVKGVGIGAKDWTAIRDLYRDVKFDWVMFACAPTLLRHPPELLAFVDELKAANVMLIDSAVFNGGFLMGSDMLDYRKAEPSKDAEAFAFRDRYLARCREFGLDPAVPAVQYAYRLGFDAVALNTSSPRRIRQNADYAKAVVPEAFWQGILQKG